MLVDAEAELPADDTEFVGINIRDLARRTPPPSSGTAASTTPRSTTRAARRSTSSAATARRSMPSTAILDREGRVAALISGAIAVRDHAGHRWSRTLLDEDSDG